LRASSLLLMRYPSDPVPTREPTAPMAMQRFTKEELAQYDGVHSERILIACQGKVYDVSRSFLWQKGKHQALHRAGCDLTPFLKDAPHGLDLLQRFPVVGILVED
jgi:predicted heme/steroid binding protein